MQFVYLSVFKSSQSEFVNEQKQAAASVGGSTTKDG